MKISLWAILLYCCHFSAMSAVILQYHHVSNSTPPSTSVSPEQFEKHLKYLADNNFTVVSLSSIMNSIKKQQVINDKTIAITFDDGYKDILTNAKPLLDKFNYPYTIFVNPSIINRGTNSYLSWDELKSLADEDVIIANHGLTHDSLARIPTDITEVEWLAEQSLQLIEAEDIIKAKTGQSWRYFAYPYGEYTPAIQQWAKKNDFIAFSQQSGAVGLATDLTSVPRFPASMPYDKISGLRDKLNSLPFSMVLINESAKTIYNYKQTKSVTFNVVVEDFLQGRLNCYISGLGRQKVVWQGEEQFTITFSDHLPIGRVRCNCTAPSISQPGRFYWYSKPWFILQENGDWYSL